MKKWSLIVFTILSQMTVGAFWVLLAARHYFTPLYGRTQVDVLVVSPLIVIEAIMLLSLLVSLAKLGSPLIAYRAVFNLRSSWLSREILFAVLFTLASGAFTYLLWRQVGSANMRLAVAWLAAIFGFLLIYSMSRLYMLRTVPVWNTLFTPISFFLSALILGGLVVGAVLVVKGYQLNASINNDVLVMVITGTLLFLGSEFVLLIGRVVSFFSSSSTGKETIQNLLKGYRYVFYNRLFLGIVGSICLIIVLLQTRFSLSIYTLCFVLVLLAELADRFLFYTARDVSGI